MLRIFVFALWLSLGMGFAGATVVIDESDGFGAFERCGGDAWLDANPALRTRMPKPVESRPDLKAELVRIARRPSTEELAAETSSAKSDASDSDGSVSSAEAAALAADSAGAAILAAYDPGPRPAALTELQAFIARNGFPTASIVGLGGMQALWDVVEHANNDPQFQLRASEYLLGLSREERGLVLVRSVVELVDRLLLEKGERQRYGTQYEDRGEHIVRKASDPETALDARRKVAGIVPARIELCILRDAGHLRGTLPW